MLCGVYILLILDQHFKGCRINGKRTLTTAAKKRVILSLPLSLPLSQCDTIDYGSYVNLTKRNLQDAQKFILMHEVVQPTLPVPYFMEDNVRFSHVAVDVVQGKDMLFHIIYLATGTTKVTPAYLLKRNYPNVLCTVLRLKYTLIIIPYRNKFDCMCR